MGLVKLVARGLGIGAKDLEVKARDATDFSQSYRLWDQYLAEYGAIRFSQLKDDVAACITETLRQDIECVAEADLRDYRDTGLNKALPLKELVDPLVLKYAQSLLEEARSSRAGGIQTGPEEFKKRVQKALPLANYADIAKQVVESACRTYLAPMMAAAENCLGPRSSTERIFMSYDDLCSGAERFRIAANNVVALYDAFVEIGVDLHDMAPEMECLRARAELHILEDPEDPEDPDDIMDS